jgi:hypothetical protein
LVAASSRERESRFGPHPKRFSTQNPERATAISRPHSQGKLLEEATIGERNRKTWQRRSETTMRASTALNFQRLLWWIDEVKLTPSLHFIGYDRLAPNP